jgi:hypothetical protein
MRVVVVPGGISMKTLAPRAASRSTEDTQSSRLVS